MECLIREMRPEDVPAVAVIEQQIFSQPWSEQGFLSSLSSADTLYLVVYDKDRLIGYCGLLQSFDEADITNVAVVSEMRNSGIGFSMLSELMKRGKEKGISRYTLEVRVGNHAAIRLYEKLGFESVGIRKNFYDRPKEDAMIMWTV